MGIARVAGAINAYVWYNVFYVTLIIVFSIGFHPVTCEVFWPDRLWILFLVIPFSGVATVVAFGRSQTPDWDGEWWGRMVHSFVSFVLLVFLSVLFFAYLVPAFATANCQPDGSGIPGLCTGGKCNNPFNDPAWFCVYNATAEAQLCDFKPCMAKDLCDVGYDPFALERAFAHFWLFIFVIVFIVMGILDLVLMYNIHNVSVEMRLLARRGAQDPTALSDGYRAPAAAGAYRVSNFLSYQ